jgi:hypothetical protein
MDEKCSEHTGCVERIAALERATCRQWDALKEQDGRIDKIMMRLNVILGAVATACVLLVVNIIVRTNGA